MKTEALIVGNIFKATGAHPGDCSRQPAPEDNLEASDGAAESQQKRLQR